MNTMFPRGLVLILVSIFTVSSFGEELQKLSELKLKNGKVYSSVTITKKTPEGIAIVHKSGTSSISFEQLPEDLVTKLGGFNAEKAKEFRQNQAGKKHEFERDAAVAAGVEAVKDIERKEAAGEVKNAQAAVVTVIQALEDGVLCKVAWYQGQRKTKDLVFDKSNVLVHGLHAADNDCLVLNLCNQEDNFVYTTKRGSQATVHAYHFIGKPQHCPDIPNGH